MTNIVKHRDQSKWEYSGYGIVFDGTGSWSFSNGFAKNVVIFGVDNTSSSHTDNCKNNCLVLGKEPTDDINGSVGAAEKKLSISFSNSYLFVTG